MDTAKTIGSDRYSLHEQELQSTLIERIEGSRELPCFILAPPCCGQDALIRRIADHQSGEVHIAVHEVREDGTTVVTEGSDCAPTQKERFILVAPLSWLDEEAAQRFSDRVDEWLEQGTRVVVQCPLQNDRYQNLQSDRIEVSSSELKESGLFSKDDYAECFKHFVSASLPVSIRLVAILTAVFGEVELEELEELGYQLPSDLAELLPELNPLFSTTGSHRGLSIEVIDPNLFEHSLAQIVEEYLKTEGQAAGTAAIAAQVATLSVALLERGNLESSHHMLGITEELIKNGVSRTSRAGLETSILGQFIKGKALFDFHHWPSLNPHRASTRQQSLYADKHLGLTRTVPPLALRLFGRFEASIEGVPLHNKYLSRTKIRRFLVYLALNQQRGALRDNLIDYLWPYLDPVRAQKNLYTSWCMLGKGLGSEKVRECPYVLREGEIYQLNPETVVSDIGQFEDIARIVLFGPSDLSILTENLSILESLYCDSLAADIPSDSFLKNRLDSYRSMMVDALLMATRKQREEGATEKALFYARAACELDESREDIYRELMDTQYVAGQRTSAMQTYFSCKQYLSDELGILPSRSTTALYQDLLLDSSQ